MGKYHAKKTTVDGIIFHSRKEADRYIVLRDMEGRGEIQGLKLQPRFLLLSTIKYGGETLRKKSYVGDFSYWCEGQEIVEDVKGFRTPIYSLKKHLLIHLNPDINFIET